MNILTFDIEEWYLYGHNNNNSTSYYLPILDKYLRQLLDLLESRNFKATFFCLGKVAKEYPEVIKLIAEHKHEIGCHSNDHQWLTGLSCKELQSDTKESINILEDITGEKIRSYRAPAFSITESNKWAFDILAENGIERDSSIFPVSRDFGGFPSFNHKNPVKISFNGTTIKEFPISTTNILGREIAYSGGGYFRMMPYWLIRRSLLKSDYGMIYLHIRDFDKEQKMTFNKRHFKNYYGINKAFGKFCKLICDFDFVNLEIADQTIDWKIKPVVHW